MLACTVIMRTKSPPSAESAPELPLARSICAAKRAAQSAGPRAPLRLKALNQANGFEHVAGDREAFGFFALKAREPTRVAHGIHHNARRGLHARLFRERINHAHRAGKLRRDVRHIALGKLPETNIEAAAAIDARSLVEARRQCDEIVGRKLEHVAREQFEKRRCCLGLAMTRPVAVPRAPRAHVKK